MRRFFTVVIALMIVMAFSGCNNGGGNTKNTETVTEGYVDASETKSRKFMGDSLNPSQHPVRVVCSIEAISGLEEENVRMEIGMVGSDYYVETNTPEAGHASTIVKGDKIYSVMHDTKTAMVVQKTEDMGELNPIIFMSDLDKVDLGGGDIQTGADELKGQTYTYEEFSVEDKVVRLLFEGDTCKAIKVTEEGITEIMLIEEYDTNVNTAKLEVPADYQLASPDEM